MKEKLQHLINSESNMTRSAFSKLLGINPATISQIMAGRNKPSFELLQKILVRFPNISADWLMLDRGPMLRDESLTPSGMPRQVSTDDAAVHLTDYGVGTQRTFFDSPESPSSPSSADTAFGPTAEHAAVPFAALQNIGQPQNQTARESNIPVASELSSVSSHSRTGLHVERVVVFYSDKTFDTYIPNK